MTEEANYDLNDFLKERDMILMAAWTLPNEGPLTEAQRRQAIENFNAYRRRHDLSLIDVARQVGTPRESTIRELLKGTFREGADDHVRTLNQWVEQHARQQAVRTKGVFVDTQVAKIILAACRLTRENGTCGLVYGGTGIGKSRCAEALHDAFVGSILLVAGMGTRHPKGLISAMAGKLGVRSGAKYQAEAEYLTQLERVVDRLRDSNRLVIIDEAHKLNADALDAVREIHDATRSPFFLLATQQLHERLKRSATPDAGQLYSRFDPIIPLTKDRDVHAGGKPLFSLEEIRRLYDQVPIRLSPDAARYLQDLANNLGMGSLRRCRIVLLNAARRARKRTEVGDKDTVTVTADDLAFADERLRPDSIDVEVVKQRRATVAAAASA